MTAEIKHKLDALLERLSRPENLYLNRVGLDYEKFNCQRRELMAAFEKNQHQVVPVIIAGTVRLLLSEPLFNPGRLTFREYTEDPEVMLLIQLAFFYFERHTYFSDASDRGLPEDGWDVHVDFQNFYEASFLGAPVGFADDPAIPPYAEPLLSEQNKYAFLEKPPLDPFTGSEWLRRNIEYYEFFKQKQTEGFEFMGRPIKSVSPSGMGTDGPFTIAVQLRGPGIMLDMMLEPDYYHRLMDYITDCTIARIKAYWKMMGQELSRPACIGLADDSIEMLSVEQYREFVLPYHKRLADELACGKIASMHLCGDATRHFPVIKEELGCLSFDTGFPVDFSWLRQTLGEEVLIYGGVHIEILKNGPPERIRDETEKILRSGILKGGRFILREANNLAPRTPFEHIELFYRLGKKVSHGFLF